MSNVLGLTFHIEDLINMKKLKKLKSSTNVFNPLNSFNFKGG